MKNLVRSVKNIFTPFRKSSSMIVIGVVVVAIVIIYSLSDTHSLYGKGEGIGAARELTPEKIVEAGALIKKGKVYDMQLTLVSDAPAFPPRYYKFQLMYNNIHPSRKLGKNDFRWSDEIIAGNLGTFTQIDCLGHAGIGENFYNGRKWGDIATGAGLTELGCENIPMSFSRGVLIDVAAYKGVAVMEGGYEITVDDLRGALKKQNLEILPSDIIVLNTGWIAAYWMKDNDKYISSEPGISTSAARWLAKKNPIAVGADTWGLDNYPSGDTAFTAHQELITKRGIYILENLVTEELVKDKVYEFAFVMSFLKTKGAGQTWGTFIAIN